LAGRRNSYSDLLIKSQGQSGPEQNIAQESPTISKPDCFFFGNGSMFCPGSGTEQAQSTAEERKAKGSALILPATFADISIHKG
jgi:hypothetical protein